MLDLFSVCNPLISSNVEKTIPCKKKMSKTELFRLKEKSIIFYLYWIGIKGTYNMVCTNGHRFLSGTFETHPTRSTVDVSYKR